MIVSRRYNYYLSSEIWYEVKIPYMESFQIEICVRDYELYNSNVYTVEIIKVTELGHINN